MTNAAAVQTSPSTRSAAIAAPEGISAGGRAAANGVRTTPAIARLAPIVARGSASASLRLRTIGPAAWPAAATRISRAPRSSPELRAMSMPTSATTPPRPISKPTSRRPDTRSDSSKRRASSATISGAAAMMIAATDESTCCSPLAMSGNGTAISKSANATSHRHRRRSDTGVPARRASTSSTAAASTTRDQARNAGGTPSSTATLMNRYGTPQIVDIAKKPAHARTLMQRAYSGPCRGHLDRRLARHDLACVVVELQLLAPAEQGEADPHERVADVRAVRHRGDAELDGAGVQPLADLVAHLPALEAAVERAVAPAPHAHRTAAFGAALVDNLEDAHAEAEVEAEEASDEQHVAPLE